MNEDKLLEMYALLDARVKVLEQFKADAEEDLRFDGVSLAGAPEYVRDYVKKGGDAK